MNLSIQDELQTFAEELQCYITPEFLEELAKEMKFVKRKRKFSGSDLATICIWISQRVVSNPLVRLCIYILFKKSTYLYIECDLKFVAYYFVHPVPIFL